MAQKHIVQLIDDLDGTEASETVAFAIDGANYEIDLSAKNASKLRDAFAVYVGSGRRAGRGGRAQSGPARRGAERSPPRRGARHARSRARRQALSERRSLVPERRARRTAVAAAIVEGAAHGTRTGISQGRVAPNRNVLRHAPGRLAGAGRRNGLGGPDADVAVVHYPFLVALAARFSSWRDRPREP